MKLENIDRIFFIGIGGIGMSALAQHFIYLGKKVNGYDRTPSPITEKLEAMGCNICFTDSIEHIDIKANLVIYTPAIPKDHKQLLYYQENNYIVQKRSEVLQWLTEQVFTIAVGGTHGKTTTSTMIAHLLANAGKGCTAFLGGLSANFNSNYFNNNSNVIVIEADEFDRSFHRLHPDIIVITSTDADHLDIYGTEANVKQAYKEFVSKLKPNGILITHIDTDVAKSNLNIDTITYALESEEAEVCATIDNVDNSQYTFSVFNNEDGHVINELKLQVSGKHNVENMVAAIAVAKKMQLHDEAISKAVSTFRGIKRRFEYIINKPNLIFVDDYAHHPTEIYHFLSSLRLQYTHKKITVIFQPHLYSRTRDFADGFARMLSLADEVLLLEIYPARELPMQGVSSQLIFDMLTCKEKTLCTKDNVLGIIQQNQYEVLATVGAGDIDTLVQPIAKILNNSNA